MDNTINSLVGNFVSNAGNSSNGLTDYQGKSYDPNTILALSRQVAASIDPNAIKGGVFGTKGESVGFNYDQATKLLGHAPSAAEQVILDMSRHLANEGVTDLNKVDASDTNRRFGSTYTGGGGTIYEIKKDADGKPVISSWSKDTSDKKTILTGLALAAAAFGIPGVTEGLLSSAPAGATLGTVGAETAFAGEALADASLLSGGGGTTLGSLASTSAPFGGEALADANLLSSGGTNLSSLAGTTPFAGETLADANLLSSGTNANTALSTIGTTGKTAAELAQLDLATGGAGGTLGAETLANATATGANVPTLTNLTGGSGVFTGAAAGITADSVAQKLAADAIANPVVTTPRTIIDPTTGLVTKAIGDLTSTIANQQGITDARNLINQYGTQAGTRLSDAYADARNLGVAGRTDLGNIFQNQNTNLNNIINAQAGVYGNTNTALGNIYSNTGKNLQNLYEQQVGYQQPYQNIGIRASKEMLANTPYFTKQFGTADLNTELAPNYAFQLGQGQMANQRLGNMGGGAMGGNVARGLQDYTQNYASGAYQNAFNNFQTQRNNIYNTLSGMANIGQTSTGQLVNLGNTYGSNMANLSNNYASNMLGNANQMQGAYNQYGSNLNNAANTYGSNLTTNYGQGMNAANVYGLNAANLATGVGSALASNATAAGANNATALSNLGNTALLGSMIKAT